MKRRLRKLLVSLLVLSLFITMIQGSDNPVYVMGASGQGEFPDLASNHWSAQYVAFMVDEGIINGYSDGTFKPNEIFTRAALAKLILLTFGLEPYEARDVYLADVPMDHWAYPYIGGASDHLMFYKTDDQYYFYPDEGESRQLVAVEVVSAMELDTSAADLSYLNAFKDKDLIEGDYQPYVALAVEYGVMNGTGENFEPLGLLTRAEACTLFARFIQDIAGTYPIDGIVAIEDVASGSISSGSITSGVITKDNPSISKAGASLTIDAEFIDGPINAEISLVNELEVSEDISIDLFDVSAELTEGQELLMTITLPYDSSKIPEGQSPEDTIAVIQHNTVTNSWESPTFTIDHSAEVIAFETTHLCDNGVVYMNNNLFGDLSSDYGTAGSTMDISLGGGLPPVSMTKLMKKSNVAVDFSIFKIKEFSGVNTANRLQDKIIGWNPDVLTRLLLANDPDFSTLEGLSTTDDFAKYTMDALGINSGVVEYSTQPLSDLSGSKFLGSTSSLFSHVGMMVSTAQFINGVKDGKPYGKSFTNLLKGAIYYKGAYVAARLGVGTLATYGLIGMWTFEQLFYPVENIFDFTAGSGFYLHKRYYHAMKDYLDVVDYRDGDAWFEVVKQVQQTSIETISADQEPSAYFNELMKGSIERYCNQFFKASDLTKQNYLAQASAGWLYGDLDRIHFSSSEYGNMSIYDYKIYLMKKAQSDSRLDTNEFGNLIYYSSDTGGTIGDSSNADNAAWYVQRNGNNTALQEELINRFINELYNDTINSQLNAAVRIEQNKIWKEVTDSVEALIEDLNETVTIQFIDESVTDGGTSQFNGYYLVPNIANYVDWKIQIDKNGMATSTFTKVEYYSQGMFTQYNLYKEIDGTGTIISDPVKVYKLDLTGDEIQVVLAEANEEASAIDSSGNDPYKHLDDGTYMDIDYKQVRYEESNYGDQLIVTYYDKTTGLQHGMYIEFQEGSNSNISYIDYNNQGSYVGSINYYSNSNKVSFIEKYGENGQYFKQSWGYYDSAYTQLKYNQVIDETKTKLYEAFIDYYENGVVQKKNISGHVGDISYTYTVVRGEGGQLYHSTYNEYDSTGASVYWKSYTTAEYHLLFDPDFDPEGANLGVSERGSQQLSVITFDMN